MGNQQLDTLDQKILAAIEGLRHSERRVGNRLGRLLGRGRPSAEDGLGDPNDPDVAKMFPFHDYGASGTLPAKRIVPARGVDTGDAIIASVPGLGQLGAGAWPFVMGRLAQGDVDGFGLFGDRRPYPRMDFDTTNYRVVGGLDKTIQIPANVPTTVVVFGSASMKSADDKTTVRIRAVIGGTGIDGTFSHENTDGSNGEWFATGYTSQWHEPWFFHARTITLNRSNPNPNGEDVTITVHVKHDAVGRGNSSIRGGGIAVLRMT